MIKKRKRSSGKIILDILRCEKKARLNIEVLILVEILSALFSLILAMLFRNVVDSAALTERPAFIASISLYSVFIIVQVMLRSMSRFLTELSTCGIENAVRKDLLDAILQKRICEIENYSTGDISSRIISDSEIVASGLVTILQIFASSYIRALGAIYLLIHIDDSFIYFLLLLVGASVLPGVVLRDKTRQFHEQVQETDALYRGFIQELLYNLIPIKAYSVENRIKKQSSQYLEKFKEKRMSRNGVTNTYLTTVSFFLQAGRIMTIFWCGVMVYRHENSIGTMMAVMQLVSLIQQAISSTSSCISQYQMLIASGDRIKQIKTLLDEPKYEKSKSGSSSFSGITANGLCFSYLPQKEVLSEINFSIEKGQFIVLTGKSGAGKTTLLKLLLALLEPTTGELCIKTENDGEQPLSAIHRGLFAYVPQRNLFLSGSVIDAITMQDRAAIDYPKVEWACRVACINFLDDLYTAQLGEAGSGFSEGQLQRIALARALYSDADILLLDEATSALDEGTEQCVLKNLSELHEKTIILVSHNSAGLELCDKVLLVERKQNCN